MMRKLLIGVIAATYIGNAASYLALDATLVQRLVLILESSAVLTLVWLVILGVGYALRWIYLRASRYVVASRLRT